jgi:glyoxylase-like metal-dependent hydrolase (beta-lactamase superfamily II)
METPVRVRVELLTVGSTAHFGALVGTSTWGITRFPAMAALIRHPAAGSILFDTGFGTRTRNGNGLALAAYRRVLPVRLRNDELINRQLVARGVDPRRLAFIFISHAHPDHIGGLGDLPPRPIVWSRETRDAINAGTALSRIRQGILPALLPQYVWTNNSLVEERPPVLIGEELPGFPLGYDLVGDGSVVAVPLPGHASGQHGVMCRVEGGRTLFLVSDAAWIARNYAEKVGQSRLLNAFLHNATAYGTTLAGLRRLHRARPDIAIVPTHCARSIAAWQIEGEELPVAAQ